MPGNYPYPDSKTPNFQMSNTVRTNTGQQIKSFNRFLNNFATFGLCQGFIGLIVQGNYRLTLIVVPNATFKGHQSATGRVGQSFCQTCYINGIFGYVKHGKPRYLKRGRRRRKPIWKVLEKRKISVCIAKTITAPVYMFQKSTWQFLNSKRTFYVLAGLGFLFKYWLVLGDEIEPFYRPADDLNYVLLAKSWYWWADYNAYTLLRPPIWPLALGLINFSEIPLRIVQELFLCGATYFLINRFRKNGLNATTAAVCFILIILHPGWLLLANRTLRECFYTSLLLILLAQLVPLANRKLMDVRWQHLLPAGITSALLWYTREEAIVIAAMLTGFVLIFWLLKQELPRAKFLLRQLGMVFLGIMGPVLVMNLTIRTINYSTNGLFITDEFSGVAFKTVYKRLMQIKPEIPKPWVSVERESLEKAYEVSPTLATIQEALSNRVGPRWAAATLGQTKDAEEIGGSAFFFALREAAMEEGIHKDALSAHNFYSKINSELETAFKEGKLEKRFVLTSYIDPEISDWITRLPSGLARTASYGYGPLKDHDIRIYYPRHNVFSTLDAYDEVTNRRYYLAYRKVQRIRGWVFLEGKEITSIEVLDHNGIVLDSTTDIYERADVAEVFKANGAPLKSGFEISLPKADYVGWNVRIVFHSKDGNTATMQANRLLKHGEERDKDAAGTLLRVTVDEIKTGKDDFATQDTIQAWLWLNHGKFHLVFGILALVVLTVRYAVCKPGAQGRHFNRWILFIALIIVSRSLIITLMDISSFRINLRYIFPALIFIPLFFGLILQEGLAGFKRKQLRW
jgi:hypothetical protein